MRQEDKEGGSEEEYGYTAPSECYEFKRREFSRQSRVFCERVAGERRTEEVRLRQSGTLSPSARPKISQALALAAKALGIDGGTSCRSKDSIGRPKL